MLINVKMPTIVDKFHAQLGWARKKFYNLRAWSVTIPFDTLIVFLKEFFEKFNYNFRNSLDPDQDRQNVRSDLDPYLLTL